MNFGMSRIGKGFLWSFVNKNNTMPPILAYGASMPNLKAAVHQPRQERDDVQTEIDRLDTAIATLSGLDGTGAGRRGGRRHLSAGARNRIAAAQWKRWAKWKAARKKDQVISYLEGEMRICHVVFALLLSTWCHIFRRSRVQIECQ
jgi:hypothetical protein